MCQLTNFKDAAISLNPEHKYAHVNVVRDIGKGAESQHYNAKNDLNSRVNSKIKYRRKELLFQIHMSAQSFAVHLK
jgi:hypothetical protein